ncbi:MAG: phosphoglycerate kinase [Patescibacteria group bacterium]
MKTVRDFDVTNKKILIRTDFNVPLSEEGEILDDFRIELSLPTIEYFKEKKAQIILMSHLGRPRGKIDLKYSLRPIALRLGELLDCQVDFIDSLDGEIKGDITLLENLRFHKGEEENDEEFAKKLAHLGDIYINDAFSVSHRAHASVDKITKFIDSGAGLLLEKEMNVLNDLLQNPQKPLVCIIGGKKIESKMQFIDSISEIADWILIGGLVEREAREKKITFKYPNKIILAPDNIDTYDIGPESIKVFKEKIMTAATVFWAGPLGKFEEEKYLYGSGEIAKTIIESKAVSIIGGGETLEFINSVGWASKFDHIMSGGSAMLNFLSGGEMPGIKALS